VDHLLLLVGIDIQIHYHEVGEVEVLKMCKSLREVVEVSLEYYYDLGKMNIREVIRMVEVDNWVKVYISLHLLLIV